ncbi:condensation domain-containing protein [Streptomyces sp. NPDC006602]|uniref:condensation domain-containing protein n=1 Tax=Streptomyces sp. NPDC006602 TaxID=3364751 RepID=UPI003690CCB6
MEETLTRAGSLPTDGHELTIAQEGLWVLQKFQPDRCADNVTGAWRLHFPVDVSRLSTAVSRTISRHALLHSVFRVESGRVCRFAAQGRVPALDEYRIDEIPDMDARRFVQEQGRRPFQLDQEPPVRIALLRDGTADDILLVVAHHIVMDDLSTLLFLREVLTQYVDAHKAADMPRRFGAGIDELVRGEQSYLSSPRAAAARDYWREELTQGAVGVDQPTDHPRPAAYRAEGSEIQFWLDHKLTEGVRRAAVSKKATPFAYYLTAFHRLLHQESGRTDFIIGYPVTLRSARRFRNSIGHFVNVLPMRVLVDPDESFTSALRRTTEKLWGGLRHRDFPYAMMPALLRTQRDPRSLGLVSCTFGMNAESIASPYFDMLLPDRRVEHAGLNISRLHVPVFPGQFDMTLNLSQHGADVFAELRYNTSLYVDETAHRMADNYVRILEKAVSND